MESKLHENLYCWQEIVNIDAITGGLISKYGQVAIY
jgi:predicted flavoprotein YhiN